MPAQNLWLLNATVVTQNKNREIKKLHVHVRDQTIQAITARTPKKSDLRGARIISGEGLVLLPGFIQTHIHLCQTLFRNLADDLELLDWLEERIWPMEAAHSPSSLHTSASLGIHELLSSGTTCILDMATVRHTESVFKAVRSSGIRANVGKCLMDHPEHTPQVLRENTKDALQESVALFKKWNGAEGDRIRASFAPRFAISCTGALLREVAQLSKKWNALIHTHASENRKEIEFVKNTTGLENVAYLKKTNLLSPNLVLAHGVWLSNDERQLLSQSGAHLTHCPSSNLKLASGIAPITDLQKRGINVCLGADGAPCNNSLSIFQEMKLAAVLQKPSQGPRVGTAQEVLDMATRNGAQALGWSDQIGSIEEGKRADMILMDLKQPENLVGNLNDTRALLSSLVYASGPQHVRMTMVDGKILYDGKRVVTIPKAALLKKAAQAQAAILKKLAKKIVR